MKRALVLTLLFAALTIIMAAPWSVRPRLEVLADNPDTHLYLWTIAWDVHAFTNQPLAIFDANIYYPYDNTLAYSENLIGTAVTAAPIIWATGDLVMALNLAAQLTCILCGLGTYLLARKAGAGPLGATLAGLIWAFAPPRFFRMGQLHMTAVQWVPFGLAFLHSYLDTGRRRDLRLAIAFFSLQALTGGHGAVFLIVAMVSLVVYRALASMWRPAFLARHSGAAATAAAGPLRDVGISGVLLFLPSILLVVPYRRAQAEMGLRRSLIDWMPTAESYLASPATLHQYLLSWLTDRNINETASAYLFPGYVVLLLTVVAGGFLVAGRRQTAMTGLGLRQRSNVMFYLMLGVLSVMMFLPPPVGLWPWLYWLPGMNFIRVPSRFMILALLALSVVAAFGFERLFVNTSRRTRAIAAALAGFLILAEYSSHPFKGVPYTLPIRDVDRWLNARPKPFVVAEAPVPSPGNAGAYERMHSAAMLHSMAHWQKTIHGYSGMRPPLHDKMYLEMTAFPDEQSLRDLRDLGVTYVVVNTSEYTPEKWQQVEPRLAASPALRLEHQDASGRVYSVVYSK